MISEIRFTLSGEDGEQKLDHKNDESLHVSTLRVGQHGAGAPRAPGLRAPGKTTPAAACAHPPRRGPRRTGSTSAWAPRALSSASDYWALGRRDKGPPEPTTTGAAAAALLVWTGRRSEHGTQQPSSSPRVSRVSPCSFSVLHPDRTSWCHTRDSFFPHREDV